MKDLFFNAVRLSKEFSRLKVKNGDTVVDATMGNGNDTAFLCDLVGEDGRVYAFDIQEQALVNTKDRLDKLGYSQRAVLIKDGHENMTKYIDESLSLILFNLGYLPKGDHNITTNRETTIKAIESGLTLLKDTGLMIVVIYSGHENGFYEKEDIHKFIKELDQKTFNVVNMSFANQVNTPPEIVCIEKR